MRRLRGGRKLYAAKNTKDAEIAKKIIIKTVPDWSVFCAMQRLWISTSERNDTFGQIQAGTASL
jgi:hypothetical protein